MHTHLWPEQRFRDNGPAQPLPLSFASSTWGWLGRSPLQCWKWKSRLLPLVPSDIWNLRALFPPHFVVIRPMRQSVLHSEATVQMVITPSSSIELKTLRDCENLRFPGGMRNPHRATAAMLGIRVLGRKLASLLVDRLRHDDSWAVAISWFRSATGFEGFNDHKDTHPTRWPPYSSDSSPQGN